MKKIYTYLTLFMLALSPAMLTSCDNDDPWYDDYYGWYEDEDDRYNKPYDQGSDQLVDMAQTLNGMWRGEAKNVVYEDNVAYETKIFVDFTFTQYSRNSNNGVGYETDYAQAYDKNGNPLYNPDGSPVYDNQTMQFNGTSTLARTIYIWSMLNQAQSIYSTSMATLTTLVSCLDGATNITRRYLMA